MTEERTVSIAWAPGVVPQCYKIARAAVSADAWRVLGLLQAQGPRAAVTSNIRHAFEYEQRTDVRVVAYTAWLWMLHLLRGDCIGRRSEDEPLAPFIVVDDAADSCSVWELVRTHIADPVPPSEQLLELQQLLEANPSLVVDVLTLIVENGWDFFQNTRADTTGLHAASVRDVLAGRRADPGDLDQLPRM